MRVLEIVRGFGQGGAEVTLIRRIECAPADIETKYVNFLPQINMLTLPPSVSGVEFRNPILKFYSSRRFLRSILLGFKPDVIIVRTFHDLALFVLLYKTLTVGRTLVFDAASEVISERKSLKFVPASFISFLNSHVSLHIAVSNKVAKGAQCNGAKRVVVHYSGADVDLNAEPLMDPLEGPRFLLVGRLVDIKRPLWVITNIKTVASDMRKSKSVLTIVGEGILLEEVRRLVEKESLSDIVEVLGGVKRVDGYYANSDVLLIGSTYEGLPITVYEAKQFGLRVLTTPAGGTSEVLGVEDRVCKDFSEAEFCKLLIEQMQIGKVSDTEREKRILEYRKFSLSERVIEYYEKLRNIAN
jgi:glycosyltransferase involved in cell wall biosynthesis